MTSFVATLHGATRKNNSRNGDPTWELNTSEGCYHTGQDSAIGYTVDNHTGADCAEPWIGRQVRFTTNSKGRITHWTLAED